MRFLDTWYMHNTSNKKKSQIFFKVGPQNDEPNKKKKWYTHTNKNTELAHSLRLVNY